MSKKGVKYKNVVIFDCKKHTKYTKKYKLYKIN